MKKNITEEIQADQSTGVSKERFGKFEEILVPGYYCLPWLGGSQLAGHLTIHLHQLYVRCETKTKDNVFVNVIASVQYRRALADKAGDAFYKLSNTRSQIQAYAFDVIRASVPKLDLDDAFEQKNEIAKAVEDELEKAMSPYGYEIVQTLIVDIEPDEHVKRAMNEINAGAFSNGGSGAKIYIVHVKFPDGTNFANPQELKSWYHSFLSNGMKDEDPRILDTYKNSFVAWLSPDEVKALKKHDAFVNASQFPDETNFANLEELKSWCHSFLSNGMKDEDPRIVDTCKNSFAPWTSLHNVKALKKHDAFLIPSLQQYSPLTTHSPSFLGLNPKSEAWERAGYGSGVIIGFIDTGIHLYHPSFSDQGMSHPPDKWKDIAYNNKIIRATFPVLDNHGHGTHVAGIAGGNFVSDVSFLGLDCGSAIGIAPRAHFSIYKLDLRNPEILEIMAAAVDDRVDVLSLSIGKNDSSNKFTEDEIAIGGLRAVQSGVLVCGSAGNDGPSLETLMNDAPWILTVGASTIDRKFEVNIMFPNNNDVIVGEALFQPNNYPPSPSPLALFQPKNFPPGPWPLSYIEEGDPFWDWDLEEKIVLLFCGEKMSKLDASVIAKARATAIIYVNPKKEGLINSSLEALPFPTVQISYDDGLKILDYITSTSAPQATLVFKGIITGDPHAPVVASFSSRGPSRLSFGILKPDVIAPGVNIIAAAPDYIGKRNTKAAFNIMSGTSQACPHVSGIAALVKHVHPNWSPAAIKSAIMTTATVVNRAGNPIEDQTLEPANAFATGVGHVDPSKAIDPGLIYEIEPQDYIAYLKGLDYTDRELLLMAGSFDPQVSSISSKHLNYPSFLVLLKQESQTHKRTLTNVGSANSSYTVMISPPEGVRVTVEPEELHFREKNQKIDYAITFKRLPCAENLKFSEGYLIWTSDKHLVRSRIMTTMLN